jgi:hypothetical protein
MIVVPLVAIRRTCDDLAMLTHTVRRAAVCVLAAAGLASAELPPPPETMVDFSIPYADGVPNAASAADLLEKPAGKHGPVVVRDGHFFAGERRIRFWGVNTAFAGNFPTHAQADAVAKRLAGFGFNCVRLHHMDNQTFPSGLLADRSGEKLSPEALERLDYFIAALKREGVYVNINLHVSRNWARPHKWPGAEQLPGYDKIVDTFHPELIAANQQFARDLLGHVNQYTNLRYADDPAVAMVEINNEDSIFMWGGEQTIAQLPEPYATMLTERWNRWLDRKYPTREKLLVAWSEGTRNPGPNLLKNTDFASGWTAERHDGAKLDVAIDGGGVMLTTPVAANPVWHVQYSQAKVPLKKGQFYSVRFRAKANKLGDELTVSVSQAHEPWQNMGMTASVKLRPEEKEYWYGFTAAADDDNARLVFGPGRQASSIWISRPELFEGGQLALGDDEDVSKNSIHQHAKGRPTTKARRRDWYAFLRDTDEAYWVDMHRFLKDEVKVKAPITGTIGFGPLGTSAQAKMDFVDQHSYWEHPHFPRRQWDMNDWTIDNKPMTDNPAKATLWALAATKVAGKPFTVTEYQHSAPNEWQAECAPMIAAFAALHDWDGVFLFSYSHNADFEKRHVTSFFDIEGNPAKMAPAAIAARLFLGGGVRQIEGTTVIHPDRDTMLDNASSHWHESWSYLRTHHSIGWEQLLRSKLAVDHNGVINDRIPGNRAFAPDRRLNWTSKGENTGTGRFTLADANGAVFAGFAAGGAFPIDLGPAKIETLQSPFAVITLVPADGKQTVAAADRLLLCAAARMANTDQKWDEKRTTLGRNWGKPPTRIEPVRATISIASELPIEFTPLDASGKPTARTRTLAPEDGRVRAVLSEPTMWYELRRR